MKKTLWTLTSLSATALLFLGAGCSKQTTTDPAVTNTTPTNTSETNDAVTITDTAVKLDEPFDLKINQVGLVSDTVEVQLAGVANDSRCPVDAQCITAGNVTVELNVAVNGENESTAVTGSGNADLPAIVTVLGYQITLLGVTPQPKTGETIAPTDYVVTLKVNATGTVTTTPVQ